MDSHALDVCVAVVCFALLVDAESISGPSGSGRTTELGAILARVAAREARVTSFRCRWARRIRHTPASMSPPPPSFKLPFPLEKVTVINGAGYAVFDGSSARVSARVETTESSFYEDTGKFLPTRTVYVQSQNRIRRYFEPLAPEQAGMGSGSIWSASDPTFQRPNKNDLFRAFHIVDPLSSVAHAPEFSVAGPAQRDGHPCVVLEEPEPLSGGEGSPRVFYRWWLAEDMDHSVLAWRVLVENLGGGVRTHYQVDYTYEADERIGWRLSSWRLSSPGGRQELCTITDLQVNTPIKPEEFEVTFPQGTALRDEVRGIQYKVGDEADRRDLKALQALESGDTLDKLVRKAKRMMGTPAPGTQGTQK